MTYLETPTASLTATSEARAARVLQIRAGEALVEPLAGATGPPCWARTALPPGAGLCEGDEVVVVGQDPGESFVLGILGGGRPAAISLADGTRIHASEEGTSLEVQRADGTPLFRYEVGSGPGQLVLRGESIDLEASRGDIRLRAAGEIALQGRTVLAEGFAEGGAGSGSQLRVDAREARLQGPTVQVTAEELRVGGQRMTVHSKAVKADLGRAVVRTTRLEVVADLVVQKVRNLFQRVQGLVQVRAGRARTVVDGTVQLKARQVVHRATESYKVNSDKIHLG